MKKFLSLTVMMAVLLALQSQTIYFQDNFDSYTAGVHLCTQNNTDWTTWSNAPGGIEDALVSNAQSSTNPNSLYVTGDNDIIYRFENQTTGVYKIEFDYYVPSTGNGAYFNIQHYFNPGTQWACEVYFNNTGGGYLLAGSSAQTTFSCSSNQWVHIIVDVDLDADLATLTVNGNVVRAWPFHYQAGNQNGVNQLGSVNFYAGSPMGTSVSGTYYMDNFKVTEVSAPQPCEFEINPEENIVKTCVIGLQETSTIKLSNTGGAPLNYEVVAVYDIEPNPASTGMKTLTHVKMPGQGYVWWNGGNRITVASGFSPSMLQEHLGKTIRKFEFAVYMPSNIISGKIGIWEMGPMGMPGLGDPIYEQTLNIANLYEGSNTIDLQTPWLIDGSYVYIGLDLVVIPTTNPADAVGIGHDDTPLAQAPTLGRLTRSTVAWTTLSDNIDGVWEMTAYADGTPIKPWMSLNHTTANLAPGANKDLIITYGASDIMQACEKNAHLYFFSTDFFKEETILDVNINFIEGTEVKYTVEITTNDDADPSGAVATLSNTLNTYTQISDQTGVVFPSVLCGTYELKVVLEGYKEYKETVVITEEGSHKIELIKADGILDQRFHFNLYPNPTTSGYIAINALSIEKVEIFSLMGQKVYSNLFSGDKAEISIANLNSGTYFVKVSNSEGKVATQKLIVN